MKLLSRSISELISTSPIYVKANHTTSDALWVMMATNRNSLPVVAENHQLIGYVSLLDVIGLPLKITADRKGRKLSDTYDIPNISVTKVMTSPAISININDDLKDVIQILAHRHTLSNPFTNERKRFISSVPVVENGIVVGLLSYIDILKKINVEEHIIAEVASTSYIPVVDEFHTLEAAYQLLVSTGVRNLLVLNSVRYPIGIVTDLQLYRNIYQTSVFSDQHVTLIMNDYTIYSQLYPQDSLSKAVSLFCNNAFPFRLIPIVQENQLYGTISPIDILKTLYGTL